MMIKRQEFRKVIIVFTFFLLLFNVLDVLGTKFILDRGGTEANPVAEFLINGLGWTWFLVLKAGLPIIFGIIGVWWTFHPVKFYDVWLRFSFTYGALVVVAIYMFLLFFIFAQIVGNVRVVG